MPELFEPTAEKTRRRARICAAIRYLLLAVVISPVSTAFGQHDQYRFDHWTTDNGLPQNTVTSIVQTRDGYLWLTTFDGLARFDGVRFTVFDKSNTRGINSNRLTTLYEARDGALLIGTEDGGLVVYRNGTFTSYTTNDGLPGNFVIAVHPDFNGEPVIITTNGAVCLRGGKIVPAPHQYMSQDLKLYLAPSGARVTIDKGGVTRVKDGSVTRYAIKLSTNNNYAHLLPFEDSHGNLWLKDETNLYLLRDGGVTDIPEMRHFHAACEDADGGVWFVKHQRIDEGDAFLARFKDGHFTTFGEADGVLKSSVNSIICDREGSLWLATSRGLYRVRKRFMTSYSIKSGLASHEVYPLIQSRDGHVWVGTTKGLNRVALRDGRFESSPPILAGHNIQALWEDAAGRLWIGMVGGFSRYENGKLQQIQALGDQITVLDVKSDREGKYWVASGRGLFKLDGDKVVAHYTTKDGLPSNGVKFIHQDRRGDLWVGTSGGLARLRDDRFISYTESDGVASIHQLRTIYEDSDETLWIGTYNNGLTRLRNGKFFNYRTRDGLFNNGVFQILEDRRGYFWIGCNKGIYRVSRHELNEMAEGRISHINSIAFGKDDGMLNSECNGGRQPAGFVAKDGRLWFPTMGGVVVIDPEAVQVNPQPPQVVIESVSLQQKNIDFSRGVTLVPGQRDLEISYTGLSFIRSEQVKFRYKLEGLDTDWLDAGMRRVAYFPNLPPGNYTFQVVAANSDGVWNDAGASVRITVVPPFWNRWWFIILVSLGVPGVIFLAFRQRVARLRRVHEAFSRQLLDSQESERERIAAELHDSLGQSLLIIKNRAYLALNSIDDKEEAKEQLDEISSSAAHAIDEVREIAYNLRPYQLDRFGLTRTLEAIFTNASDASDIRFSAKIDNIDGLFPKAAEISIYRIVQESVNNIIKHSHATEARLLVRRNESDLQMRIEDNGQGFKPGKISAGKQRLAGFGLIGMAERVHTIGGTYTIDSAPGKGTTIIVKLMIPRGRTEK